MSRETLEFHHDIHHKAYVDNGNKLVAGTEWESRSLEEIVAGTYQPGAVAQTASSTTPPSTGTTTSSGSG
jgi:Fe-Mn family superoxide dismutase